MFSGFTKRTVDFLWELKVNNNREWYGLHKEECKEVLLRPMNELANTVYETFEQKRPDMEFNIHISRIYRDARRLFGRGPFKDYLWFTLYDASAEHWDGKPSFWFEIASDRWSYGMGCYEGSGELMRRLRKRITVDPEPLRQLDEMLRSQKEFRLGGEDYKKQYQDCPHQDLQEWYGKKYISIGHEQGIGPEVIGPELADRVSKGMLYLAPFYDYFYPIGRDQGEEAEEE